MANNRRVFDLWFEIMRAELEELVRVPVTSRTATEIPPAASAYRSQLLFEGPVHGVMYVTASASSLVQLSQMVAGEPVDPKAAWTRRRVGGLADLADRSQRQAGVEIVGRDSGTMRRMPARSCCRVRPRLTVWIHLGALTPRPPGAAIQELMLQAGEAEFALSVSAQVMFPGDDVAAASVDQPGMEKTTQEPVETVPQANSSSDLREEPPLPKVAAAPREDSSTAQPVETQARVDPPAGFTHG